jgi:hypothetical protein
LDFAVAAFGRSAAVAGAVRTLPSAANFVAAAACERRETSERGGAISRTEADFVEANNAE